LSSFNNVGWTAEGQSGAVSYGYVPESDLIGSLNADSGLLTSYLYAPHRNLRTTIRNELVSFKSVGTEKIIEENTIPF
jgi:hypothetical protein